MKKIVYYLPKNQIHSPLKPSEKKNKPLRILFLTSLRDIVGIERNGGKIETRKGLKHMPGLIPYTIQKTLPGGELHGLVEIVGIVTDDTDHEKDLDDNYPRIPINGLPWLHSFDLQNSENKKVIDLYYNIPSTFRKLPKEAREQRKKEKYKFEMSLLNLISELNADIIVSYHYMAKIEFLFPPYFSYGKVLNIHPGITDTSHPFCMRGFEGEVKILKLSKEKNSVLRTGATLHIVDNIFDNGQIIAINDETPVYPNDQQLWLIYRNHMHAELPVFIEGIAHYSNEIYPHLNNLDFHKCNHPWIKSNKYVA